MHRLEDQDEKIKIHLERKKRVNQVVNSNRAFLEKVLGKQEL
jgi:hypothetical protein